MKQQDFQRLYRRLVILSVYVLLTLVMTYPFSVRLNTHLLSSTNDFWIYPWNNWWVKKVLTEGGSLYTTSYLFYPQGATLYWHGFSWFGTLIWLPLQVIVGSLLAHNATVLLTYVIGAYTAYLLAYEITNSHPAAIVAGLVYAFYPHRFSHRGQLKLLSNQWIPLVAFYLVRLTRRSRLRDGLGVGIALVLCGLCGWHQLLLAGMWVVMWLPYSLLTERLRWGRRTVRALLTGGLTCALLLAPLLIPMVTELIRTQGAGLAPAASPQEKRTDLLAFILTHPDHSLLHTRSLALLYQKHIQFEGAAATVGWAPLFLAGWAMRKRREAALPWLILGVIFAVLALGSALQVNGSILSFPLPYALLKPTFFGTFLRHPNRFNIVLALPVSVLAAVGWQAAQMDWACLRRRSAWATMGLSLLILFEYSTAPVPIVREPYSPFYQHLKQEEGRFVVADFPIDLGRDKYYLFLQTLHERPMVGGHVSRPPVDPHAFIEKVPVLTAGREDPPKQGELDDISRQLGILAEADVRYVMIHKDRLTRAAVESWRRWFGFQPAYEDDLVLSYRTDPAYGRDFGFLGSVGDGVGVVTATLSSYRALAGEMVQVDMVWGTAAGSHRDWTATIRLLSESDAQVDVRSFEPFPAWPTSEWGVDELAHRSVTVRLDPFMDSGYYEVLVGLDGTSQEALIGKIEIEGAEHFLTAAEMEREGALFGERLQLLGYDLKQRPDAIAVTLHWQSLGQLDEDYKFFVHLYDVESGELEAQKDVMPLDWTYPTTWWERGEVVSDHITLPLSDLVPGDYTVAVGVYHPKTGERLPIQGRVVEGESSDSLALQEITLP